MSKTFDRLTNIHRGLSPQASLERVSSFTDRLSAVLAKTGHQGPLTGSDIDRLVEEYGIDLEAPAPKPQERTVVAMPQRKRYEDYKPKELAELYQSDRAEYDRLIAERDNPPIPNRWADMTPAQKHSLYFADRARYERMKAEAEAG